MISPGPLIEHSKMGVASFVLSFFPGMLFAGYLVLLDYYGQRQARGSLLEENGAPLAAGGFFLASTILLAELVALGLGVAALTKRARKKLFAFLGIACSLLVFYIAYAQDVVRLL